MIPANDVTVFYPEKGQIERGEIVASGPRAMVLSIDPFTQGLLLTLSASTIGTGVRTWWVIAGLVPVVPIGATDVYVDRSMGTDYGEFVVHSRAHRSRLKQLHGTLVFNDAISFEFIENSLDLSTRTRFTISIFYRYYLILRFEFLYSQINIRKESNSIQIFKADYRLLSRNVFLLWSLCKTFCN